MEEQWFVLSGETERGPATFLQLQQFAQQKLLRPDMLVKRGPSGDWTEARNVNGLFAELIPAPPPRHEIAAPPNTRSCPFCAEQIRIDAVKCRHCGEFMDGRQQRPQQVVPPVQQVVVNVSAPREHYQRWSPGLAAFLSFLFPGLGQAYKTQFINALVWLVLVISLYVTFPPAGLVAHVCCIIGALSGDPHEAA